MKKSLMMLGAVAMMLASCTNEEVLNVSDSRAIGFNGTGIDNITKADVTSSNFAQFYVYGGYTDADRFGGTEVNKSGSSWTYNPTQYWKAGEWKFGAYAPKAEGINPTWAYATGLTLDINSDADHQNDVVYAGGAASVTENEGNLQGTGNVSLNFTHLLSKLAFKFTKDPQSLGAMTVTMSDFVVAGITTNGQWIAGATVFVYDHEKFTPADMLRMIQDYKITSLCAPPTIFRFLIREDLTKYDLSSLQYCTIAGEALNPAVYETFYKLTGIKLMEGFGQTETTLTIATFPWMEPKPGSMGMPNPQYDIDLIRPDGTSAEDGEQGQIVIHTQNGKPLGLFKEYYRDAERTREAWHDGLYYTGDVAWRDQDGYYWFVGRADDVIKSSGYRIGPFEVESALMTHPAVVECAITGVPDEIRGQVVKATIVLSKEYKDKAGEDLIKELQDHVKRVTAPYKYPRVVEFVDELPKTISGKIRRVEIRDKDHQVK